MNFGTRTPAAEAHAIVDRAIQRGATHFDTANLYGDGESERILGRALMGRRDGVRIATKVGLLKREGLAPERVLAALDQSLNRLQTDRVDLYYLHAPDPATPFDRTLDAIATLLESGKIASWGVSNFAAWQIAELDHLCDRRKLARPRVAQMLYNVLVRQLDFEFFAFAKQHPIEVTVYNPLAGGLLARDAAPGAGFPKGSRFEANALYRTRYWTDALLDLAQQLRALAAEAGWDGVALAYAWLAGRPGVDSILSGPATVAHLDAAIDGCAKDLPADLRARVDALHRAFVGTDARYAR